jgi:hypothetical protein
MPLAFQILDVKLSQRAMCNVQTNQAVIIEKLLPLVILSQFTKKETEVAIRVASPVKGFGPDGITNKALQAGGAKLTACAA